jgi:hypothetical protein
MFRTDSVVACKTLSRQWPLSYVLAPPDCSSLEHALNRGRDSTILIFPAQQRRSYSASAAMDIMAPYRPLAPYVGLHGHEIRCTPRPKDQALIAEL